MVTNYFLKEKNCSCI